MAAPTQRDCAISPPALNRCRAADPVVDTPGSFPLRTFRMMSAPVLDSSIDGNEELPTNDPSDESEVNGLPPTDSSQLVSSSAYAPPAPAMIFLTNAAPQWIGNVTVPRGYQMVPTNYPSNTPEVTSHPSLMYNAQLISSTNNVSPAMAMVAMPTAAPPQDASAALPQAINPMPFQKVFLEGKPFVRGLVLVIAAAVNVALGVGMIFTVMFYSVVSGNPFWGALFYLITGILTMTAQRNTTGHAVTVCFAMSIICATMSLAGMILASLDLALIAYRHTGAWVVCVFTLLNNFIIFSTTISISVVCGRALKRATSEPQVVHIGAPTGQQQPHGQYAAQYPASQGFIISQG